MKHTSGVASKVFNILRKNGIKVVKKRLNIESRELRRSLRLNVESFFM